jgi:hypothetical protein
MNTTVTGPRRPQARHVGHVLLAAALVAAVVVGLLVSSRVTSGPSAVPELTIANPTLYQVDVDVTGADRSGWLPLGSVRRESEQTVQDVIDPGQQWVFRFRYGGRDAGELTLSRDDLRAAGWRITVPQAVGDRLRDEGVGPSAR